MSEEVDDVRTALRKRLGNNEKEIELMLSRYVGQHLSFGSRPWATHRGRSARQARSWMPVTYTASGGRSAAMGSHHILYEGA